MSLVGAIGNDVLTLAAEAASTASGSGPGWMAAVPLLPLLASALCGLCLAGRIRSKLPAAIVVLSIAAAFAVTLFGFLGRADGAQVITIFEWIGLSWGSGPGETLSADFGFYMDGLSWLWMLFVTGLGSLIALYASEYMSGDKGYARFFAAFALFVFAMACLVMGDNLVLLYLGWEGVGLCSYLLIGYFYKRPAAVAAAKKAFIVNRIGDLGLAIGVFLTFVTFGTVEYDELFRMIDEGVAANGQPLEELWQTWTIPLLLMVGAFGKSAQLPLYVWLPDAMEGPTPVSALIHAATMVTAGVYLVARMFPLFVYDGVPHYALNTIAWVGTLTALFSATIGMAQFDIKRIMAYSTVSQLGYMFAGLGFLTTTGAAFHVFTHAFFKATLFLCCGAVMHGFAGQLDLRRLSGLIHMKGWLIVSLAMLVGCLNLAGFPLITAGYFSKDMILSQAFTTPDSIVPYSSLMGWILLITAGLTAYYTFRVFFRVFVGPVEYEPGDEVHDHGHDDHDTHDEHGHDHGFHPHAPGWAINTVLAVLAIASFAAIGTYFVDKDHHGWVGGLLHDSSAAYHAPAHEHHAAAPELKHGGVMLTAADDHGHAADEHAASHEAGHDDHGGAHAEAGTLFGQDPHAVMYYVSAAFGIVGIFIAWLLHYAGRKTAAKSKADLLLPFLGPIPTWAQNKWYVDELYDILFRGPLWLISHLFHIIDRLLVDGIVDGVGGIPRALARSLRVGQSGILQNYAVGMAGGLGVLLLIAWILTVAG